MISKNKREKKAEFYVIMSLIIAAIIAGLTATVNYAVVQPQPVKFYDLSENIQSESTRIIDYSVLNKEDVNERVENFTKRFLEYAQERDPNLELVYVYGDATNVTVVNYAHGSGIIKSSTGTNVTVQGGGESVMSKIEFVAGQKTFSRDISQRMEHFRKIKTQMENPGDWIRIEIAGEIHDFNLAQEKNFMVVMETNTTTEVHVTQTEEYAADYAKLYGTEPGANGQ